MGKNSKIMTYLKQKTEQKSHQKNNRNFFSKFGSLEEFRNYRLSLRKQKDAMVLNSPMTKDHPLLSFLMLTQEIIGDFKNNVRELNNECSYQVVSQRYAKCLFEIHYSKMCEIENKSGQKYSCAVCYTYFIHETDHNDHLKTEEHKKICRIYIELFKISSELIHKRKNSDISMSHLAITEKSGLLINLEADNNVYSSVDAKKMGKEQYALGIEAHVLKSVLPTSKSQFTCRCCNYAVFPNNRAIHRHFQSARHLEFERNFSQAFCEQCQKHYGDVSNYRKHLESDEHKKILELKRFTRQSASDYWEFQRNGANGSDSELMKEVQKEFERINIPCKTNFQSAANSELEKQLLKDLSDSNLKLTKAEFVTSVLEKELGGYWPSPQSKFYCRCCNYQEFADVFYLNKHFDSVEHQVMRSHYDEAFCLSCQVHTVNSFGMKWHCKTECHLKLEAEMKHHEDIALKVWNKVTEEDVAGMKSNPKTMEEEIKSLQVLKKHLEKLMTKTNTVTPKYSNKENINLFNGGIPMWY